jgi:5'-nucleotidase
VTILLTNDDGISSPGLRALEDAVGGLRSVLTVAPEKEQSAKSHCFTLHKPLRARPAGEDRWSVSGTPADCSYIGINHFANSTPSIVLSGINRGPNLGNDVFYSGTVAGAREACMHGIPSAALSLDIFGPVTVRHWETAALVARWVAEHLLAHGVPEGVYLNVNIPNIPPSELKGKRFVRLGARQYHKRVDVRPGPRGKPYFWIGGGLEQTEPAEHTDMWAIANGYAAITPLTLQVTDEDALGGFDDWKE